MNVTYPTYSIIYNGKNITADVSDHLISLTYSDKVEAGSDEIELQLEDSDLKWQNDWYPDKGATITAAIAYNGTELKCGTFTIDEIEISSRRSEGDVVSIRGLSAGITKKLRTKKHSAHESKTLKQLAEYVAKQHGLTVQGKVPAISFSRMTQHYESDLEFLRRISDWYGLVFSIRDNVLTFHDINDLHGRQPVAELDKTEVTEFRFTDKSESTHSEAKVSYRNSKSGKTITHTESAGSDHGGGSDVLQIKSRVENKQQAEAVVKSRLIKNNTRERVCQITLPGNTLAVAGVNIRATGFGKLSGVYHISESRHDLSRDGYTTEITGGRVAAVPAAAHRPKVRRVAKQGNSRTASVKPVRFIGQMPLLRN